MSYTHLTSEERYQISALRRAGHSRHQVAAVLGRDVSTISRELRRNRGYRLAQAQRLARERACESRTRPRITAQQRRGVQALIRRDRSPEQIAAWARHEGTLSVSAAWIYRFVHTDRVGGGELYRHLRCQRQRRKRYGSGRQYRGRIVGRVGIERRPAAAAWRTEVGHWEGDTLIGKGQRGASLTLTERCSRLVRIGKLPRRTTRMVRR